MTKDIHGIINAVVQITNIIAITGCSPSCSDDKLLIEA